MNPDIKHFFVKCFNLKKLEQNDLGWCWMSRQSTRSCSVSCVTMFYVISIARGKSMAIHHAGHSDGITARGSFWMRFATVTPMLSVFRFVFQKKNDNRE